MDMARKAGKMEDVEKLTRRLEEPGPYELLCVVRALLKKIKQRVLVGRVAHSSRRLCSQNTRCSAAGCIQSGFFT
jgi:hypothetical protein